MKYRIILVDDHNLFRNGLKMILENHASAEIIFEAGNGEEFLQKLQTYNNEIVFMDIRMPVMNGIEATRKATERFPGILIIALSMYGDEEYYFKMIDAGAKGFLLKDSDLKEVKAAIEALSKGETYFSEELLFNVVKGIRKLKNQADIRNGLTGRETEIVYHICKGLSNQEISQLLNISKRTVDKHRQHILDKTGATNTASLVMFAIKNGLVEL